MRSALVAELHADAETAQAFEGGAGDEVAAADGEAAGLQQLGQGGHADPTDADEVEALETGPHVDSRIESGRERPRGRPTFEVIDAAFENVRRCPRPGEASRRLTHQHEPTGRADEFGDRLGEGVHVEGLGPGSAARRPPLRGRGRSALWWSSAAKG